MPEAGLDRGEEVEQADEAVADGPGEAVAPGGAVPLASLAGEFRAWLEARSPGSTTVQSYSRALERFLQFVRRELGDSATHADLPRLLGLVAPYRTALEVGSFPAPQSELALARSALGALERFAKDRAASS